MVEAIRGRSPGRRRRARRAPDRGARAGRPRARGRRAGARARAAARRPARGLPRRRRGARGRAAAALAVVARLIGSESEPAAAGGGQPPPARHAPRPRARRGAGGRARAWPSSPSPPPTARRICAWPAAASRCPRRSRRSWRRPRAGRWGWSWPWPAPRRARRALARAAGRLLRGGGAGRPRPRAAPSRCSRRRMAPDLDLAEAAGIGPAADSATGAGCFLTGAGESGSQAFHPLFREFLRRRFEQEVPPAERRAVAARLADALEAAGRGPDAVAQRIASEDWDAAADAVAREGGALVRRAPETVDGWLAALPADRARRPELDAPGRTARARPGPAGRGRGALPRGRRGLRRERGAAVPALRRPLRAGRRLPRAWATSPARPRSATRSTIPAPTATSRRVRWARWRPSRSRSRAASRRAGPCATARSPTRWRR